MIKGNKGEWSELYVFSKLLLDGILYQSDLDLNIDLDNYYKVVKIFRTENKTHLEYNKKDKIEIIKSTENEEELIDEIEVEFFKTYSKILFSGILNGIGKSFKIPEATPFLERTLITKLTAKVSGKADIKLKIYDHRLAKEADLGFSIKSLLGQDSTLFNTGKGNNFIYLVKPETLIDVNYFNNITYKPIGKISKITERLNKLNSEYNSEIKFFKIQSKQLWRNLKMVDGDMPEILAFALFYRYFYRINSFKDISKLLEERDPLNYYEGENSEQKFYENKLKRLLVECSLGMTSEKPWHRNYDANGGVIICKKDGEIVCFHVYDFNLFKDYLLNNTMFEQASTSEDKNNPGKPNLSKKSKNYHYSWLYEENGELFIKLNLQIRFI